MKYALLLPYYEYVLYIEDVLQIWLNMEWGNYGDP